MIRPIKQSDNPYLAIIVRSTLAEYDCDKPGTAFADPETDFLYEQFRDENTAYFVVESDGKIVGGAGIGKLKGYDDICELQKMYLLPEVRGKGLAKLLMDKCVDFAKQKGFKKIYLESMPELQTAIALYTKYGFIMLDQQLSQTGHFSCSVWMLKEV